MPTRPSSAKLSPPSVKNGKFTPGPPPRVPKLTSVPFKGIIRDQPQIFYSGPEYRNAWRDDGTPPFWKPKLADNSSEGPPQTNPFDIFEPAPVQVLENESTEVGRATPFETFLQAMDVYDMQPTRLGPSSIHLAYEVTRTGIPRYWANTPERLRPHEDQLVVLILLDNVHRCYDKLETREDSSFGLSCYYRISKRPEKLKGGSWGPYCDPYNCKNIHLLRVFEALYQLMLQLDWFRNRASTGKVKIVKPIDLQWCKRMLLETFRAWDDLAYLEQCHGPVAILPKRPVINHPDCVASAVGAPSPHVVRHIGSESLEKFCAEILLELKVPEVVPVHPTDNSKSDTPKPVSESQVSI